MGFGTMGRVGDCEACRLKANGDNSHPPSLPGKA